MTTNTKCLKSFSGGIAQLGERLHGMQEVDGSIPSSSTNPRQASLALALFFEGFVPFV